MNSDQARFILRSCLLAAACCVFATGPAQARQDAPANGPSTSQGEQDASPDPPADGAGSAQSDEPSPPTDVQPEKEQTPAAAAEGESAASSPSEPQADASTTDPSVESSPSSQPPSTDGEGTDASPASPPPALQLAPPGDLPVPPQAGAPAQPPAATPEPAVDATPVPESPAPASSAQKKLLVMQLKANGAPAGIVSAINAAVQQQATRSFVGEVVTTEQLRVSLDANAMQQMLGCDSENCMADFGARVDAQVVLGGNVSSVGDDLIITILALEPSTGRALASEQRKVPQVDDLVFYAARQLTSLALTGRAVDPTVPVRVTANASDAAVLIDGRSVGVAPVTVRLDPGQHQVEVKAEDYTPWKLAISVEEGAPLSVDAMLEEAGGFPLWPIAMVFGAGGAVFGAAWAVAGMHSLERRYGSPSIVGWTASALGNDSGFPVLFDPVSGPYDAPNKDTAQLSADSNMILLLALASDVFMFMTIVSILAAGALVTTDMVMWALEE